ncbi:UNVERIFIED_ORG: hypothetical protein J2W65_000699 [Pseudomonas parafulva]|nr:hypothetical protein [Pseudomonas parafulva]
MSHQCLPGWLSFLQRACGRADGSSPLLLDLNEDVIQCVIFDGNAKDAKIMGGEYIMNEKLFASLPAKEKAMWHSHGYEVSSVQIITPGIPALAEHALMERLAHTCGKRWHPGTPIRT